MTGDLGGGVRRRTDAELRERADERTEADRGERAGEARGGAGREGQRRNIVEIGARAGHRGS